MLFVEYPTCTTCQKARKWLEAQGKTYTSRHIKEENPTEEELKLWWERSGLPLKRFFNTSGLKYKELSLKDKLPGMSEAEQLALLASDGMLVKRPIPVGDDFVLVASGRRSGASFWVTMTNTAWVKRIRFMDELRTVRWGRKWA